MKATEIRVDGGEWKPYVEEETILNAEADLAKWAQAGPGGLTWNAADGGFFRPRAVWACRGIRSRTTAISR